MGEEIIKDPVYDERVKATIQGLMEGKTRDELAEEFKLGSWKSLDTYMRRKNFTWDGKSDTYIPVVNRMGKIIEEISSSIPIKAEHIIRTFEEYGGRSDPKIIAQEHDFENHKEMAEYMEENRLFWDFGKGNYVKEYRSDPIEIEKSANTKDTTGPAGEGCKEIPSIDTLEIDAPNGLLEYIPILKLLSENKDRLIDLFMVSSEGKIPVYGVPGTPGTKSIYMSNLLSRLMTDFSKTKNLSQRDIVEGAIVEYLKRYGYKLEVEKLLSKR